MHPANPSFAAPDDRALFESHLAAIRGRYEAAMIASGVDTLVIDAGAARPWYRDDIAGDWRVNPHFRLFTPCSPADDCAIVLRHGETPVLLHLCPEDYWHLPPAAPEGIWTGCFDIRTVGDPDAREREIDALRVGMTARIGPGTDDVPDALLTRVDRARAAKTPYELACMRAASARAAHGHLAAAAAFRDGAGEHAIQLAYLAATEHEDAELPYRNIIALDTHCAVLHYQFKDRLPPVGGARSFLIDAGADVAGYAADVTRTHARERGAFADLVTAMDALQRTLVREIRAGVSWVGLHRRMHDLLAGVLVDGGIATGATDDLVERGITRHFLPHGLGHLLGTQTHDAGGQLDDDGGALPPPEEDPALRLTRTLGADWVVTVEPGLYFIPMLLDELRAAPGGERIDWRTVDALMPFGGIRIEDNVRVTADGAENLTRNAFADAATTLTETDR